MQKALKVLGMKRHSARSTVNRSNFVQRNARICYSYEEAEEQSLCSVLFYSIFDCKSQYIKATCDVIIDEPRFRKISTYECAGRCTCQKMPTRSLHMSWQLARQTLPSISVSLACQQHLSCLLPRPVPSLSR